MKTKRYTDTLQKCPRCEAIYFSNRIRKCLCDTAVEKREVFSPEKSIKQLDNWLEESKKTEG